MCRSKGHIDGIPDSSIEPETFQSPAGALSPELYWRWYTELWVNVSITLTKLPTNRSKNIHRVNCIVKCLPLHNRYDGSIVVVVVVVVAIVVFWFSCLYFFGVIYNTKKYAWQHKKNKFVFTLILGNFCTAYLTKLYSAWLWNFGCFVLQNISMT